MWFGGSFCCDRHKSLPFTSGLSISEREFLIDQRDFDRVWVFNFPCGLTVISPYLTMSVRARLVLLLPFLSVPLPVDLPFASSPRRAPLSVLFVIAVFVCQEVRKCCTLHLVCSDRDIWLPFKLIKTGVPLCHLW